ncbi:hypothetical protein Rhopal_002788-T1 [Rhodotorula paludigena]|uniref:MT-A70-domain-containing protein n=1 Tax=Rhodotorula paludigena TaxID=86838 RepID=A0AAV5GGU8_9BASI|nr:hypothetical protein Rhopal_002788-T1 [Rhodotorula paludigena]
MQSVLCTAELPAFDRSTGQLSLAQHHLVSSPLSILGNFSTAHALLFDRPPAQAYQQPSAADVTDEQPRQKRRRKSRPDESSSPADWALHRDKLERQSTTDRQSDEHHASISLGLSAAIDAVRDAWLGQRADDDGWMGKLDERVVWRDGGDAREELNLVGLAAEQADEGPSELLRLEGSAAQLPLASLFRRIVVNDSQISPVRVQVTQKEAEEEAIAARLLVPPSSGFLVSDMSTWSARSSGIAQLGRSLGGWDVLLIDPPWPNASATRSSSYETFDPYDLWKLDVPALLNDKPALVCVWLTNRVKVPSLSALLTFSCSCVVAQFRRLVKDKLFPAWRIKQTAEWYWIKIASRSGEPVWSLEAKNRRCYEGLLLGYYVPPGAKKLVLPTLPTDKVFLSTPIGHSRKPVLIDIFRPFLLDSRKPPNVLDLFARMTLAGPPSASVDSDTTATVADGVERGFFLAVGNEAVKFNVVDEAAGPVRGWVREGALAPPERARELSEEPS